MNIYDVIGITIPEGSVIQIKDHSGNILWSSGFVPPPPPPPAGYVYIQDGSKVRIISVGSNYFTYSGSKITFK